MLNNCTCALLYLSWYKKGIFTKFWTGAIVRYYSELDSSATQQRRQLGDDVVATFGCADSLSGDSIVSTFGCDNSLTTTLSTTFDSTSNVVTTLLRRSMGRQLVGDDNSSTTTFFATFDSTSNVATTLLRRSAAPSAWRRRLYDIINVSTEMTSDARQNGGKARYVKPLHVRVSSNTQIIQSSDWPKWFWTLGGCVNSRILSGIKRHF